MAQQSQQQGGDNSMAPIWIMALLILTGFLVWKSAHEYIVSLVFGLNIMQARLVNFFIGSEELSNQIYLMQTLDPSTIKWDQLLSVTRLVGEYIRYPVIVIIASMAVILHYSNITMKFRKIYNMNSLRKQEQYNWTAIMPVIKENLIDTDLSEGPWAMGLSPMEFAHKYKLLKKEDIFLNVPAPGQEMTAGIRRSDAKRVFTLQLGPYWDGFERCPPHAKALAAVFWLE
jgi:intracellular multiplication protein IcmP